MPETSHDQQGLLLKNRGKLRDIGFLWDLEKPLPRSRSKNKIAIHAAKPKDRERLRKIVLEAYLPEWSWWVGKIGGKKRAREDLMSYISRFLRDPKKRIFVAEEDERVIGFSGAAKYNRDTGTIGYGVAVLPGFRKRGIGAALLVAALDWLRNSGVRFVTLEGETFGIANQDTPAIILYKSLGGQIISDQPATR
jgi:ribosomal protein S18 acetylase RimI-like enzyme